MLVISIWLLLPFPLSRLQDYSASRIVRDRADGVLRITLGEGDALCRPVSLEAAGPWAARAAVASEDKRFFSHPGIDPLAAARALGQNLVSGRIVSGASTISTLVVKLTRQPSPRTIGIKLVEAFRALQMEQMVTKRKILEQYLNRAPFGANLIGIETASWRYFGRAARDMSLAEAALLLGIPQSPARLRPDRHPESARKRRDYVLERMEAAGFITKGEKAEAQRQPLFAGLHPLPRRAPHFCDLVLARYPGVASLRTALDPELQAIAEEQLRRQAQALAPRNVSGGAVVIVHVPSAQVRALVGSPDFFDPEGGQVNCAVSPRSPGSALKPFIYALAMDRGLCAPSMILMDIPVTLGDWQPQNFGEEFHGPVTVRQALVQSLNIPALQIARRLGASRVLTTLRQAGLSTLTKPAAYYGLGLAVGTGEVTLLDLCGAYAALARGGIFQPARLLLDEDLPEPRRIFSPAASYLIADILSGDERALSACGHAADARLPRIAWKTGTSNGLRDAWAIAYNPEYVVGVWFGNPDGEPSPALVGGEAAAPPAYEIFRRLYPDGNGPWFTAPPGLETRAVCARTGLLPNPDCPLLKEDLFIAGVSPFSVCAVHQMVPDAGIAPGGTESGKVIEVWPPETAEFLVRHGMSGAAPAGGRRSSMASGGKPAITSPADGQTFRYLEGLALIDQRLTLAATGGGGGILYWFINGELFGSAASDAACGWPLRRGSFTISCSDGAGRSDRVRIRVE